MKRNKIFCILASLTMLVAAGASASYNNSYVNQNNVVRAASEYTFDLINNNTFKVTKDAITGTANLYAAEDTTKTMDFTFANYGDSDLKNDTSNNRLQFSKYSSSKDPSYASMTFTTFAKGKFTTSICTQSKNGKFVDAYLYEVNGSEKTIVHQLLNHTNNDKNGDTQHFVYNDLKSETKYEFYINFQSSATSNVYLYGSKVVLSGELFPVTSITSTDGDIELAAGSNRTLNYTVAPANYTDSLTWSSTNEDVATVVDGVVTTHTAGDAVITVTADSGISYSWNINVPVVAATSIELDRASYEGYVGDTVTLTETVLPEGASNIISWSSTDETVATVVDGVVTLVGEGTADIIVSTDNSLSATCAITSNLIKTTSVEFASESMNVGAWDTLEVKATVLPENTQEAIVYTSSNEEVATVVDGVVTTLKEGTVTITCTSGEYSDEVTLVISNSEASLSFEKGTGADEKYAVAKSTYHINGFRMNYNKTHGKGAQCGDIEFNVTKSGTITFNYYETGGDKHRMTKLSDAEGNVIAEGAANTDSGSTKLTVEAFVNPGYYVFKNIVIEVEYEDDNKTVANEVGVSTLINLESISFVEAKAQLNYQYDSDENPTAIRFIGTVSELEDITTISSIKLSLTLDGVAAAKEIEIYTLYTSVADTTFVETANTYYVVHAITGITSAAIGSVLEVTMTITYADSTSVAVTRTITLGN